MRSAIIVASLLFVGACGGNNFNAVRYCNNYCAHQSRCEAMTQREIDECLDECLEESSDPNISDKCHEASEKLLECQKRNKCYGFLEDSPCDNAENYQMAICIASYGE